MIGVFDSGYGGLTILHGLTDRLPRYSYVYIGDNARAPYGSRSAEEIIKFTQQGVTYLFEQGASLVILACNTASAIALRPIQREFLPQRYPNRRVLGIIVPTIEQITGEPWNPAPSEASSTTARTMLPSTVGILATDQTVRSGTYAAEIHKRNPALVVIQQACPGLVPLIEAGGHEEEIEQLVAQDVAALLAQHTPDMPPLRSVLLGCTHFELISSIIQKHLPADVTLYHQPTIVALSLQNYLTRHPEIEQQLDTHGQRTFYTTADPASVSRQSEHFFGNAVQFSKIPLV